jgi:nitronate monooxygenase
MAGGGDTPALAAAVCNAGGLGFLGAAYLSPAQIAGAARQVRSLTKQPFGINLFAPSETPEPPENLHAALRSVAPYFAEMGLPYPALPDSGPAFSFDDQLEAVLDSGAACFSFTFGLLPEKSVPAIKARGIYLMGTATTVDEAEALAESGVDAVIAQGGEAGGHRGTFASKLQGPLNLIGTMPLVPQIVDAVKIPVIASGGIMDGRGIKAALALGATAVQMGTAFLTCDEAGIPEIHKRAILQARENDTRITRAFSGRPARGIVNRFMNEIREEDILPFPLQNALTRPLRTAAAKRGEAEFLSLWAGQGLRLARRGPAGELVARLLAEIR